MTDFIELGSVIIRRSTIRKVVVTKSYDCKIYDGELSAGTVQLDITTDDDRLNKTYTYDDIDDFIYFVKAFYKYEYYDDARNKACKLIKTAEEYN